MVPIIAVGDTVPQAGSVPAPHSAASCCHAGSVHLLLVEDDEGIAGAMVEGLRREGFTVTWVATGAAAHTPAGVDRVLLALGLPDPDGFEVCRKLRASSAVPIIVVTARDSELDKVVGLELGADDYLAKPFGFRELVARIRAVLRRSDLTSLPLP